MICKARVACLSICMLVATFLSPVRADEAAQSQTKDESKVDKQNVSKTENKEDPQPSDTKDESKNTEAKGAELPAPAEAKSDVKKKKQAPKTIAEAMKLINQKLNGIQRVAKQMEGECYRGDTAMNPGLEVTGGFGMVIPIGESAPGSQSYQPPRARQIRQLAAHAESLMADIQEILNSVVVPEDKAAVLNPLLDQLKSSVLAVQQHQNNVSGNLNAMEVDRGVILSEAHFFDGVTKRVHEDGEKLSKAAASK